MKGRTSITTRFNADEIRQSVIDPQAADLSQAAVKNVMSLRDEGVRRALIDLGWLPPDEAEKLEAERDALAAHEELLEGARRSTQRLKQRAAELRGTYYDAPTSLARRDARMKAEALEEALDALECMDRDVGSARGAIDATWGELGTRIRDYRRQAEGGSDGC